MLTLVNLVADVPPQTKDSSSTGVIIGVIIVVVVLAAIGLFVARRRKAS